MSVSRVTKGQLQRAIKNGDIVPWYQPVVDRQGQLSGVEVLARWIRKDGVRIPPDIFIPLATDTGMIDLLTRTMMVQVAQELLSCVRYLPKPFNVAFNIPASCLADDAFRICCRDFLSAFPPTVRLTVEITERDTSLALCRIAGLLKSLIQDGIEVALDDFGTGYSNLNLLCQIPLTTVKLDRMFCTGEPESAEALTAATIIQLVQRLGMRVLAEGVETFFQAKRMELLGVDAFQGFYFSRPVPISQLMWRILPGALALQAPKYFA